MCCLSEQCFEDHFDTFHNFFVQSFQSDHKLHGHKSGLMYNNGSARRTELNNGNSMTFKSCLEYSMNLRFNLIDQHTGVLVKQFQYFSKRRNRLKVQNLLMKDLGGDGNETLLQPEFDPQILNKFKSIRRNVVVNGHIEVPNSERNEGSKADPKKQNEKSEDVSIRAVLKARDSPFYHSRTNQVCTDDDVINGDDSDDEIELVRFNFFPIMNVIFLFEARTIRL